MTRTRTTPTDGPPQGTGHYSDDGARWWDDHRGEWLHTTDDEDTLEIELEDVGNSSWLRSIATTMSAQHGTQVYRFVGRARSRDPRWPRYDVASGTFPVLPLQLPLDELDPKSNFADDIFASLDELHHVLVQRGWRPAGHGEHWWSRRYIRPGIEWDGEDAPADAATAPAPQERTAGAR